MYMYHLLIIFIKKVPFKVKSLKFFVSSFFRFDPSFILPVDHGLVLLGPQKQAKSSKILASRHTPTQKIYKKSK